jgi:phage repressor protein C with HTH and peptisase S24 domain
MTVKDEMIDTAAKWWSNKLSSPSFNNGANDPINLIASLLASSTSEAINVSPEQTQAFEENLKKRIEENTDDTSFGYTIRTDYQPEGVLAQVAHETGIPDGKFPWKTYMRLDFIENTVEVAEGYGAQRVQIYPKLENK